MEWTTGDAQKISVNVKPSVAYSKDVKVVCVKQNRGDDGTIYSRVETN
jgi:hypothetical protein